MTAGLGNILGKTITAVTKTDAKIPIVALEGTVIAGRTDKAYKRGGVTEARERVIEETSGSVVWLWGVQAFNWLGDKALGKFLNATKGANGKRLDTSVDVGQDAVRKPFNNFLNNKLLNPKNLSERTVSLMKFGKVAASILAANYIIGFIVPPLNHKLTNYFAKKDKEHIVPHIDKTRFEHFKESVMSKDTGKSNQVAFKGGLNTFTNFIENTNTGQLLSTDLGVLGGRTYNARKKQEKAEIIIRDGGSIYFYMWAQDHVRAGLNKAESGRWTRLDPNTAGIVHKHLSGLFENDNSSMSVNEFKETVLGKDAKVLDLNKFFGKDQEAITLEEFNKIETNPDLQKRALEMSKLQPKQLEKSVLTKKQVIGVYTGGKINAPDLLKESYEQFTGGASSNPNKYVSYKKLEKLNDRMKDYVDDICKAAEKGDGKVNKKLLNKMKQKNLTLSGVNFLAGFAVASLFLSRIIPDLQYWYTRKTTGRNDFPGTCDYSKGKPAQPNQTQKVNDNKKAKVIAKA